MNLLRQQYSIGFKCSHIALSEICISLLYWLVGATISAGILIADHRLTANEVII